MLSAASLGSPRLQETRERLRVLVTCDRLPYPLENGQNLRIFHYVRHLASQHEFDLLCYGATKVVPTPVAEIFHQVKLVPPPSRQPGSGIRRIVESLYVDHMVPPSFEMKAALEEMNAARKYDVIWVSGWDTIVNIPPTAAVPVLADAVDDGLLEFSREFRNARSFRHRLVLLKWLFMVWRFERKYFAGADASLFVSDADAASFSRISPRSDVFVVNNGVDVEYFQPSGVAQAQCTLVFEGNIAFAPNHDGVLYFIDHILPLVAKEEPAVKFVVVGKDPPPDVIARAGLSVQVTGYVEDVRPYLDSATVFVCPLRKGAGIKNKILQAWAMGKPVVATSVSVGGLRVQEGGNLLVRDDAEAFARAVLDVLRDKSRQKAMAEAARATAVEFYSWSSRSRELERVLLETSKKRRGHA